MQLTVLKSKIHNAIVTDARLDYVGSITIDKLWLEAVNIRGGEKVLVVNNQNGARIETYVIEGKSHSKTICLNGAAAHHFKVGDDVIIMAFAQISHKETLKAKQIFPQPDGNYLLISDYIKQELQVAKNQGLFEEELEIAITQIANKYGVTEELVFELNKNL